MENERRADLGEHAVVRTGVITNVTEVETASTAVTDVLAYIAHYCNRLGLNPEDVFPSAIESYYGDFEDGPAAERKIDGTTHNVYGEEMG